LVVIAIIAILAAILFLVFAQAREKARERARLSNCKRIGLAMQTCMNDWDDRFAASSVYPAPDNFKNYGFRMGMLHPYVKTQSVYKCPSTAYDKGWAPGPAVTIANYGYNEYLSYLSPPLPWNFRLRPAFPT
jgi:type II secretory pathway pseudopilin PulG